MPVTLPRLQSWRYNDASWTEPHGPLNLIPLASGLCPGQWERANLAALISGHEEIERLKNDLALQRLMKRHTKVMTHHERDEDSPWRLAVRRDIEGDRNRDSRDVSLFDRALNQRD